MMKTFEDYVRQLVSHGGTTVRVYVSEYGVTAVINVADHGPVTFTVVGDEVTATTEPILPTGGAT